jgi:hypothetical protein
MASHRDPFRNPSSEAERLALALEGRRVGNHWEARCPAHDDHHPSLHVTSKEGQVLFKCWAGCSQASVIDALKDRRLWEEGGIFISRKPVGQLDTVTGLTLEQLAEHKKLPIDFLQRLGLTTITYERKPAVRIPYLDESGQVVSVRFRVSLAKQDGIDRFKWKTGNKVYLYGLWRLPEARKQGRIVIVEGESDCLTLWFHGIPAIGAPGASNWMAERDEPKLDGIEKIYVVVEPDQGGDTLLKRLTS